MKLVKESINFERGKDPLTILMKQMKLVRENINFERGKDPLTSMGIGPIKNIQECIDKLLEIDSSRRNLGNFFIRQNHVDSSLILAFTIEFLDNGNDANRLREVCENYFRKIVKESELIKYLDDIPHLRFFVPGIVRMEYYVKSEYHKYFKQIWEEKFKW